jgi:hypothetical protein
MANNDMVVMVDGHVQWRFEAHRLDKQHSVIITPRHPQYPPIPIGAELFRNGEAVGTVTAVIPEQFQRWEVHYAPVGVGLLSEEDQILLGETELRADIVSALEDAGIATLGAVRNLLEQQGDEALLDVHGIGPKSLAEIKVIAAQYAD